MTEHSAPMTSPAPPPSPEAAERRRRRQALLNPTANPNAALDYLVTLAGHVALAGLASQVSITVRYVPDRLVAAPGAFAAYLEQLGADEWRSLEEAAATVLDDANNELVARWVQVRLSAPGEDSARIDSHDVLLEDRQPAWDNPALLGRLKRL